MKLGFMVYPIILQFDMVVKYELIRLNLAETIHNHTVTRM
jgi:hypothetical protein